MPEIRPELSIARNPLVTVSIYPALFTLVPDVTAPEASTVIVTWPHSGAFADVSSPKVSKYQVPAGVIDDDAFSITITLEAIESVTVPAGTFNNALRLIVIVNDGLGTYTEKIWLAKGIGAVQMFRVSETNNTPGCFFTCGSLSLCGSDTVEERYIKLQSFISGKNRVVVIPLGN